MVTAAILYNFGTGPGEGLRRLALRRPGGQPLHRVLLHAPALRRRSTWGGGRSRPSPYDRALPQSRTTTSSAGAGWRTSSPAVIMLIGLGSLGVRGLRYDIDFTGGTLVQVRFEQPPSRRRDPGAAWPASSSATASSRSSATRASTSSALPLTADSLARSSAKQVTRRPAAGAVARQVRDPPRRVRRAPGRARAAAAGDLRRAVQPGRHPALHRVGLQEPQGRGGGDRRRVPRHDRLPGRPVADRPGVLAAGAGGAADDHRLLGQRHDRRLRPAAREPRQVLAARARASPSR